MKIRASFTGSAGGSPALNAPAFKGSAGVQIFQILNIQQTREHGKSAICKNGCF
jgi:hypothetical protein